MKEVTVMAEDKGATSGSYLDIVDENGRVHIVPSAAYVDEKKYARDHGIVIKKCHKRIMPKGGL
jgi:hypothetical protein